MTDSKETQSMNYEAAGVNIDAGNALVERIKPAVKRTQRPEVLGGLGGFGGLFALSDKYKNPVLVSGTDGVGTKLKLAMQLKKHSTIGIDLVAMCVNDIIVTGAEPLFFLDYYATGKLDIDNASDVISGIANGCEQAGAALIGGETAEMPGMYKGGDYDLAGFTVGVVEKDQIITGDNVKAGQSLIALASSGPHSNGYSLIRHILDEKNIDLDQACGDTDLGSALMAPTKIYVKSVLKALEKHNIHALAHITGGGLLENIPRVLPEYTEAHIDISNYSLPPVFALLQEAGNIEQSELYRTFNCGIGMIIAVDTEEQEAVINTFNQAGETAFAIGSIASSESQDPSVILK